MTVSLFVFRYSSCIKPILLSAVKRKLCHSTVKVKLNNQKAKIEMDVANLTNTATALQRLKKKTLRQKKWSIDQLNKAQEELVENCGFTISVCSRNLPRDSFSCPKKKVKCEISNHVCRMQFREQRLDVSIFFD